MGTATKPRVEARLMELIGSFGLPVRRSAAPSTISTTDWPGVLTEIAWQNASGLAVAAAQAGELLVTNEQWEQLLEVHRTAMTDVLDIERVLLSLIPLFGKAGIDVVVLKGPAIARAVYPDPAWRAFGDLDLLVRTRDWEQACRLLTSLGLRRQRPEPRPGFERRFGKAAVHRTESGIDVDLHRTLVLGPFGLWMRPDELFARTVPFLVADRGMRRLDDSALLLHASMHAALGLELPRLLAVRDVAQVAWFGAVDWSALGSMARRWRLEVVVRHAFNLVTEVLGGELPQEARAFQVLRAGRRERNALAAYTTARRARGGTARATLRAIPGLGAKAAYVRALLLPERRFLVARAANGKRPSYWGRWALGARRLFGSR